MSVKLPTVDIVVLLVYLVAVVAFGCWFVRRSRNTEGFMAAGRSLPGWAVGLSIFGTYLSSNTFIGLTGKTFGTNWNPLVFSLSLPIAAVIAVRYFVPFYRRSGEISAYSHLQRRFGGWARTYAVVCYLLTQVARMGSIMFGVALALSALLGWDMATIILVTGVVVTLYTLLGGIEAVIWTDVAQSIVLTGGALLVLAMLVFGMPGGPAELVSIAAGQQKFSLGGFGPSLAERTFWVVLAYGLFINLNNFGIDQSFVQRYHAARSTREAVRSVWLGALLYVPISLVFVLIGTFLFSYYHASQPDHRQMLREVKLQVAGEKMEEEGVHPSRPDYPTRLAQTAAELKPDEIGDKVLPHFIANRLPRGVAGLLIAAIFAAAMSSIDTSLNSSATVILSDIYKPYFRPNASQRESMRVLYGATLVWGTLGTGLAVAMIGVKSVLDAWWKLSGIFTGAMLGLFLLGLLARRAGTKAAVIGVIFGVGLIGWMTFTPVSVDPVSVNNLQLRADARPHADKFDRLIAEDAQFARTWNRQRQDLEDQSPRAYDLAMAEALAAAGWPDQEVADAVIAARREHAEHLDEILDADTMRQTLYRAKTSGSLWPDWLRSPLHELLIPVFGSTAIVLAGFLVGLVLSRSGSHTP